MSWRFGPLTVPSVFFQFLKLNAPMTYAPAKPSKQLGFGNAEL